MLDLIVILTIESIVCWLLVFLIELKKGNTRIEISNSGAISFIIDVSIGIIVVLSAIKFIPYIAHFFLGFFLHSFMMISIVLFVTASIIFLIYESMMYYVVTFTSMIS